MSFPLRINMAPRTLWFVVGSGIESVLAQAVWLVASTAGKGRLLAASLQQIAQPNAAGISVEQLEITSLKQLCSLDDRMHRLLGASEQESETGLCVLLPLSKWANTSWVVSMWADFVHAYAAEANRLGTYQVRLAWILNGPAIEPEWETFSRFADLMYEGPDGRIVVMASTTSLQASSRGWQGALAVDGVIHVPVPPLRVLATDRPAIMDRLLIQALNRRLVPTILEQGKKDGN